MTKDTGLCGDSSDQLIGDAIHLDHVQILVHLFLSQNQTTRSGIVKTMHECIVGLLVGRPVRR